MHRQKLNEYGVGMTMIARGVTAADIGGTTDDAVVRFTTELFALEQFGAWQDSAANATIARVSTRGVYWAGFGAAFVAHGDTAEVILGISVDTDAAGLNSAFAITTTGRLAIQGPITMPLATALDLGFELGRPFRVSGTQSAATPVGIAAGQTGRLVRAHATVGASHPSANTVDANAIPNWTFAIERLGDLLTSSGTNP